VVLSRLSGWYRLSKQFSAAEFVAAESAWFRSASLSGIQYSSCLNFAVNDDGLRISVILPFRIGHPPIVIPWNAMHHVQAENKLFSHRVKVSLGSPTMMRAAFPGWVRYRMPMETRPAPIA
jgi:hypothetical protein